MRKTRWVPSGEIATVCAPRTEKEVPCGGAMAKRETLAGFVVAFLVKRARAKPAASRRIPTAEARMTRGRFAGDVLVAEVGETDSVAAESFPDKAFSMAMRASPMDCKRCRGSLLRQRRRSARIPRGRPPGRSDQSGSARITAASVSEMVSP